MRSIEIIFADLEQAEFSCKIARQVFLEEVNALIAEGHSDGYHEGYDDGYSEGYSEGYELGLDSSVDG